MAAKFHKPKNDRDNNVAVGVLLYGKHAVTSALENKKRIVQKVWCVPEMVSELQGAANRGGHNAALIKATERKEIDKMLPPDAVHQGVAAAVKPLEGITIEELCDKAEGLEKCQVLVLDQVTDPQNVGAIVRSCAAFGTLALVMQDKNAPAESGAMVKASAGTFEFLPICRVTNLSRAIEKLKNAGFWVVGMDGYAKTTIDKMNKNGKIAVVMGSEGKGMRRLVEESCDETVKLKMDERVESLNVSTAAAIALYEVAKG